MSLFENVCSQLFKQRFLYTAVVSCLVTLSTAIVLQSNSSYAVVPTNATSVKKAPFSQVFFTGSVYAVKDKDYESDQPSIGFFSVWRENPTNNQLSVAVQYCLPPTSSTELDTHLNAITLLDHNQPLVTINQIVAEDTARLRLVQPGYYTPYHGFGDPFDDQFLNPLDENVDPYGIRLPTVTCNAGSNQFDLTKLASAIAQLPNRTLQVKLVFSNGEIQNWHLGKATVQAIKNLLAIRQTLMNSPNLLPTGVTR